MQTIIAAYNSLLFGYISFQLVIILQDKKTGTCWLPVYQFYCSLYQCLKCRVPLNTMAI